MWENTTPSTKLPRDFLCRDRPAAARRCACIYNLPFIKMLNPLISVARQAFLLSRGVEWPGGKPTIFPSEEEERVSHARTAGPFHVHQKGMQTILYGTVLYFPEKTL